jgi:DNA polymerase III sliding clamp (beta) subunit (PCNA family)
LESNQANIAVKEILITEEQNGEATSDFNIKSFLDCVESFQSSWIKLHFIEMQADFYLCKLTSPNTVSLLCPVVS